MSRRESATLYELFLRRFPIFIQVGTLIPFYILCLSTIALSLWPSLYIGVLVFRHTAAWPDPARYLVLAFTLAFGYLVYGLTLILIVPIVNKILVGRLKPWRGVYHSGATVRWYIHNGLAYLCRFTFLEFITPTPLNVQYFRMMGMKIGRNVQINTTHISDPSLIEMEDHVTIGGSAVIVAHYGVGGYLVLSKVKIGRGATVGLRATIMGGVQVGAGAKVLPNSVVLPKTVIPDGETWGGVPAQKLDLSKSQSGDSAPATAVGEP